MSSLRFLRCALIFLPAVLVAEEAATPLETCIHAAQKRAAGSRNPFDSTGITKCMEQYADGPAPLTLSADAQAKLQQASPSPAAEPARRPAVNPEQPPPAPAIAIPAVVSQPATRIPDADFARVKPGLAYSELFALLGKPYSRVEGDSLHLTYRLESGKIGRVLVENRAVTSVRITE